MKPKIVVSDYLRPASGNDTYHIAKVLTQDGHDVRQVGPRDVALIVDCNPNHVLVDPSFYASGVHIDEKFMHDLIKASWKEDFGVTFWMTNPPEGLQNIVDKSNHPEVVRSVENYTGVGTFIDALS